MLLSIDVSRVLKLWYTTQKAPKIFALNTIFATFNSTDGTWAFDTRENKFSIQSPFVNDSLIITAVEDNLFVKLKSSE